MATPIQVTASIALDPRDIEERFILSSGPGGQNVNKVATAVQLRFQLHGLSRLPPDVIARLARLAGRRLTGEGVLVISARRHRSQERNREEARAALVDLLRRAAMPPAKRVRTRIPGASREKRLAAKAHRATVKNRRRDRPDSS